VTLFLQHARAQWRGLLIWSAIAAALMLLFTRAAPAILKDDMLLRQMSRMPEPLQAMMGIPRGLSAPDAFVAMQVGPYSALLLSLFAVLQALSVVTREVDRRTVEFLLALPVQRRQVLLARAATGALYTAVLGFVIWAAVRTDLSVQGIASSGAGLTFMLLTHFWMAMALGAIALLASIWIDDYSLGVKSFLGLVVGSFFVEMVLRAAEVSRAGRLLSPFSYADAIAIFRSGAPHWGEIAGLAAVAAAALLLSLSAFERKQIAA
jgi:ABC-2 type transport system permease protein